MTVRRKLLIHRVTDRRDTGRPGAFGVMMKKRSICRLAERRIAGRAQDQAMPGFIHRVRRHPDDLAIAQGRRTAPTPLPQTSRNTSPRLPGTTLEHRRRQLKFLDRTTGCWQAFRVATSG